MADWQAQEEVYVQQSKRKAIHIRKLNEKYKS